MKKLGKDSGDQFMGADFSSACYGMALLPVSSVWDVFEFSGIAAGAGFDDSGNHDIAYRRIFAFGSRDSC